MTFYYTKELSINADDLADAMVEFMYDDGAAFADLINKMAEALYENEFDADDAYNYARGLDENGRKLVRELHEQVLELGNEG